MGMTREELLARRQYIGSSDVPAILGFDPYRSIMDVWLDKTGRTEVTASTSDPAEFGTAVEPVLIEWAGKKLDLTVERGRIAHHPDLPFLRAQMDGWVEGAQAIVEAKAYGLWNPRWDGRDWGADGTDLIPFGVMAQVNFQMACATAERAYVVALLGNGMGVRVYSLPRNEALVQEVQRRAEAFWTNHVLTDVPPDAPASLDTLKAVLREPDSLKEIDHDWPDRWLALKDQEAMVTDAVKEARRAILQEMGDAEVGFTPFGEFSYRANVRGVRTFRFHGLPT